MLPEFEQAQAKLDCEIKPCCLRARSASEHRIPQPPSPPGFGTDRAQELCVKSYAYGSIPNVLKGRRKPAPFFAPELREI